MLRHPEYVTTDVLIEHKSSAGTKFSLSSQTAKRQFTSTVFMAPVTRSQTTIVRRLGLGLTSDVDFVKMFSASKEKAREHLSLAVKCTRRCLYCGRHFKRERHPRPSLAPPDESMKFPLQLEVYLQAKVGRHAKQIQEEVRQAKKKSRELEEIVRVSEALEAMPERKCCFCGKWCKSSPFVYKTRLRCVIEEKAQKNRRK